MYVLLRQNEENIKVAFMRYMEKIMTKYNDLHKYRTMSSESVLNYLGYARSVLGVEGLSFANPKPRVVIETLNERGDYTQLLSKMLAAINLEISTVEIDEIDRNQVSEQLNQTSNALFMLSKTNLEKFIDNKGKNILSPHPLDLMAQPELKKQAWDSLKLFKAAHVGKS